MPNKLNTKELNTIIMAYNHQDWNNVVLKSSIPKKNIEKSATIKTNEKKYGAGKNSQNLSINGARIERKFEEDELTIPKVSREFQLQMAHARQQKGLTQKQLANACNLTEHIIKDYENGTAIPQSKDIVKMNKVLGVTLKK